MEVTWLNFKNKEPSLQDLPFVCRNNIGFSEAWEDSDWFDELTDNERAEWTHWKSV